MGLHEVWLDGAEQLWVAATAVDAVHGLCLRDGWVDLRIWPRQDAGLRREIGLEAPTFDLDKDQSLRFLDSGRTKHRSHLHLNAVSRVGGRMWRCSTALVSCSACLTAVVLMRDERLVGADNIVPVSETRCLVNEIRRAAVLAVDLERRAVVEVMELRDFAPVRELEVRCLEEARRLGLGREEKIASVAKPLFLRAWCAGESIYVGLSPATVLETDLGSGVLLAA